MNPTMPKPRTAQATKRSPPPSNAKREQEEALIDRWLAEFDQKLDELDRRQDALAEKLKRKAA